MHKSMHHNFPNLVATRFHPIKYLQQSFNLLQDCNTFYIYQKIRSFASFTGLMVKYFSLYKIIVFLKEFTARFPMSSICYVLWSRLQDTMVTSQDINRVSRIQKVCLQRIHTCLLSLFFVSCLVILLLFFIRCQDNSSDRFSSGRRG